ncbi:MAG TPA: sigma factor-like helix-turn-helix DNA-binding protein [Ktedonobacteraceae bacterium]|nr:sigma factor-like helix-turn-helix DNA-binding protein [Ktedonobacteraceae bacterium]
MAQAGRELGVTRERARQIEERALQKLRNSPAISALRR